MISSLVDTRHLDAFLAVCQEGTLARAALRIHKTQPAISYDLRRLEDALGVRLFERSGRVLILTAHGRRLRELGEQYAAAFHQFRQQALGRGTAAEPHAPIRLSAVSGFGRYVLYPRLRDRARDVNCQLELLFRTAVDVFRMVEEGQVDCGAVYHTKVSHRLQFTPVYKEELVLIIPRRLKGTADTWRHLRTYTTIPFVTYEEAEYVFGRWFDTQFGEQPPSGIARCHFTELEEVIDAVASGFGASIVPLDAVPRPADGLRIVRPRARRCFNQVFRVCRTGSLQPPLLDAVFEELGRERHRKRTSERNRRC
ncbi:MAG: LysR family transcriptional regulator [Luteitalea sp.]|nr:LysR family transcriptional regulator [Luteitalea sp.]